MAVVARVPEALQLALMKDGRILRHLDAYRQLVKDELVKLSGTHPFVWLRISKVIGDGRSPIELFDTCMQCASIADSYMDYEIWSR